jgi:ferritin-like metal-binding protein YciE
MKQIKNLSELLVQDLRNLYSAEKIQVNSIPALTQSVHSQDLRTEMKNQLERKRTNVTKLEKAFGILKHKPAEESNPVMSQILDSGINKIRNIAENNTSDAGIIGTVQNANHFGITNYGTACAYARASGQEEVAKILHNILNEEKKSDTVLSELSEGKILPKAGSLKRG